MPAKNKIKSPWYYILWLIFGVNAITILLLLSSFLAWSISPSKTALFAYIGLGFPFVVVINSCFLLLWILLRQWRFALVALIGILICWKPIVTYIPYNLSKEIPENKIKILSYNVRGFNWDLGDRSSNNPIFKYISESNADIVCLQEYLSGTTNNTLSDKDIKKILKHYPYSSTLNLRPSITKYTYGLACYSKYPIISATQIPIKTSDNGAVEYKIKIKNKTITVINNHLESNRITADDKKLYKKFFKEKDTETLDNIAHNIKKRLGIAYKKRSVQADLIAQWIDKQETDATIVCGDFNDTPISYTYSKIKGNLVDSYAATGKGIGITYHENKFLFRIDYIMHSPNIQSFNCLVDKVKYSDHYPIWSYIQLE